MDFGNIIFIGIVVLAVISNVAKTVKKAKVSQSKPLVGRPLAEATVIQTTPVQVQKNKPKLTKTFSVPPPMFVESEEQQIFVTEEMPVVDTGKEYGFSNPAEIRKGIIFSEIFNRKY